MKTSLAVDRDFASKGEEKQTDFIDCVAWRQTGEFASKYFQKGSMAAVKGRLQIRDWQDKDGNKRRSAEVVVDNIYFCGKKESSSGGEQVHSESDIRNALSDGGFTENPAAGDGDLPF